MLRLVLIILLSIGVSCKKSETAIPKFAVVFYVKGSVNKESKGLQSPVGTTGEQIQSGDYVITGKDGQVDLLMPNESLVRLKPNTKVQITVELWEPSINKAKLQMFGGKIFVQVNQKLAKEDEFRIQTTTQVAGVRGTTFQVTDNETNSQVAVLDGSVSVSQGETEEIVEPGSKSESEEGNIVVSEMTEEEKNDLKSEYASISQIGKEQMQSIWEEFEKGKAEIRKDLDTQKENNQQLINEQKEKNKQMMDETKSNTLLEKDKILNQKGSENEAKSELEKLKNSMKNQ
ncbi:FecR family protein [Leptospira sp. 96542]|nr:FecR family protein [Leptospira sp. 96542]